MTNHAGQNRALRIGDRKGTVIVYHGVPIFGKVGLLFSVVTRVILISILPIVTNVGILVGVVATHTVVVVVIVGDQYGCVKMMAFDEQDEESNLSMILIILVCVLVPLIIVLASILYLFISCIVEVVVTCGAVGVAQNVFCVNKCMLLFLLACPELSVLIIELP